MTRRAGMIELQYQGARLHPREGETVLDALLRAGVDARFSCRSGTCHTCMIRRTQGEPPPSRSVSKELRQRGYFLACQSVPTESMTLEPPRPEDFETSALVADAARIAPDIVCLRLEPARELKPRPGQHIEVVHPSGAVRPYSIASIPEQDYFVDLHVRRLEHGRVSTWLADEIQPGDEIRVRGPVGRFFEPESGFDGDRLLVATGTGLAPLMPMLRNLLEDRGDGSITLLHGVRHPADLYLREELEALAREHQRLTVRFCCSRSPAGPGIRSGRVTEDPALAATRPDHTRVFIAGHPEMVDSVRSRCRAAGIAEDRIYSDRFCHAHVIDATVSAGARGSEHET